MSYHCREDAGEALGPHQVNDDEELRRDNLRDIQCTNATMSHQCETLILDEMKVPEKPLQSTFACLLMSVF